MTYLQAYTDGTLEQKIKACQRVLKNCTLCPRHCRIDRLAGETGYCRTAARASVASFGPHFGEEACLVGTGGSGTIFFCGCNLMCSFCQNYALSRGADLDCREVSDDDLASVMIELQNGGCHNINFVTPTHVTPKILSALPAAIGKGVKVPLVYNCGGYESLETLHLLGGIIDIYMPDAKFYHSEPAARLLNAADYPVRMREALTEMQRQVGDLVMNKSGLAERGLLVRHLLMPGGLADIRAICRFLAEEISPNCYLNIMDQYHPCGAAKEDPQLAQPISHEMYQKSLAAAQAAGLTRVEERDLSSLLARILGR